MMKIYKKIIVFSLILAVVVPQISFGALTQTLKAGDSGNEVSYLQDALIALKKVVPKTGYFGQITANALKSIQCQFGIACTNNDPGFGIVGPKTRSLLNSLISSPSSALSKISPRVLLGNISGSGSGLLAYYPFDTDGSDASGNNKNGTLNGATISTGKINNALSLNGGSNVAINDGGYLASQQGVTVSVWIYPTRSALYAKQGVFEQISNSYTPNYNLSVEFNDSNDAGYLFFNNNNGSHTVGTSLSGLNKWYHIVAEADSSGYKIYVNNALAFSDSVTWTAPTQSGLSHVGDLLYGTDFGGLVDDLRIYNRSIDSSEVSALYSYTGGSSGGGGGGGGGSSGDTTAPSVPTNVSSSAVSSSAINISWNASTDNVAVIGYRIYRNNSLLTTTTSPSYADTGLSASTAYSYTVAAYDAAGNVSAQSSASSATTAAQSGGGTGGGGSSNPPSNTVTLTSDRTIDWTKNAGLNYTIPSWPNGKNAKTDYGAVGNGIADDTTAIQNCINNTPIYTYCYIPAGTYKITSAITMYSATSNRGIRGAGSESTIIQVSPGYSGDMIDINGGGPVGGTDRVAVTSGATKGSTRIYLDGSSYYFRAYRVGDKVMVMQSNGDLDENTPGYMNDTVAQVVKVTAVGSNYIDIATPLDFTFNMAFSPRLAQYQNGYPHNLEPTAAHIGIEDLGLTRLNGGKTNGTNVGIGGCENCWVRNIHSKDAMNYHVQLSYAYGTIVRDSFFEQTWQFDCGGNACYGVWVFNRTSDSLIENNIFKLNRHTMITEYGGTGNIFGYNYSTMPINENQLGTDYLMGDMITHGGDPRMNLWEGNVAATIKTDNVLGSSRWNTFFRNDVEVKSLPTTHVAMYGIDDQAGNVNENFIGNIFGSSGLMTGDDDAVNGFRLGCLQDNCHGTDYLNRQLPDARPAATMFYNGNYDYKSHSTVWSPTVTNHTLPNSLYLSAKPLWWGSGAWPGIGPDVPGLYTMNPAELRYTNTTPPAQTAPIISAIASSPSNTTAIVTWTTDQPTSSTLNYGTTASYGSTLSSPTLVTSHIITIVSLTPGTTYHYQVQGANSLGSISASSDFTFITTGAIGGGGTGGDTTTPSIPTGLTASAISSGEIDLVWNASTDNVGVTGYKVYRDSSLLGSSLLPSYIDSNVSPSTTYSYTVSAYDLAGNTSLQSNASTATTQAVPVIGGGSGGSSGGSSGGGSSGGGGYSYPASSPTSNPIPKPVTFPAGCTSVTVFSTTTGQRCVPQSTTVNFAPPGCINGAVFNTITGQRCLDSTITAYSYNRDLTIKSQGNDVKALQQFLIAGGYLLVGNDSGYFGALTQTALIKYQKAKGISPASGYFGSLTRKIIMGGKAIIPTTAIAPIVAAPIKPVATTIPSKPIVALSPTKSSGISKTLTLGATGNDVLTLQRFLILKNFLLRGKDSGTFDTSTAIALGIFQISNGIISSVSSSDYGVLNEATRIKINAQLK